MDNLRSKEPLLAVLFSMILTGLGQVYSGKLKRGILFFCILNMLSIPLFLYVLNYLFKPDTTINLVLLLALFIPLAILGIFVFIDAYRCAKAYNISNNLTRNITAGKRILLISGIIFFGCIVNPSAIFSRMISSYVKNNLIQTFRIPTITMEPTLSPGDLILADKAIYKKSLPKRGDVVVFIYPKNTEKMFVKRLVGLPGEKIEIKNGSIVINGAVVHDPFFVNRYYYNRGDYAKEGQQVVIPTDSYFVLGDNSASSQDSRYFGFVPKEYLIGKAFKIYFPFDRSGPIK